MRLPQATFPAWIVFVFSLFSCTDQNPVLILADPWLGDFADSIAADIESHLHLPTEVQKMSSEVAVQHVHHGSAADILLLMNPENAERIKAENKIEWIKPLASDPVVKVECLNTQTAQRFRSEDCWMAEADDRPSRMRADDWFRSGLDTTGMCLITANFDRQAKDYLLRGWVRGGFVWRHFAKNHPGQLKIVAEGPEIRDNVILCGLTSGFHHSEIQQLAKLFMSERAKALLAGMHFNL